MESNKHIVISLGGSLIYPQEIDTVFLKNFTELIREYVLKGYRFNLIAGGGKICRKYNDAVGVLTNPTNENLDWLGIAATRLNAELLRVILSDITADKIVLDPDSIEETDKPVTLGGGWKPGNSSDLAAIHTAKSTGATTVINLSNIDYVYNKDPNKFPDAVKIEKSSWAEFRKLLPEEWNPGLNAPFDPIAAREAESLGLRVVVMNGKNIDNLKDYLDGKNFVGTIIE